jgi:hypothetical protein
VITCDTRDCEREAIMAIASRTPRAKQGLVSTIYQFVEDAPKVATRTCGQHGVQLAAQLAALTDGDLRVSVDVTEGAST